jgi:hypothetical protein
LTSPSELKPLLKGSFPAFVNTLGHIRFFYLADEIWDGESSLVFSADGRQLAAITLQDSTFTVSVAEESFHIADRTSLSTVFEALRRTVPFACHRPSEQLVIDLNDPNQFPCGRKCDLCLGSKQSDEHNYLESENFGYLNWVCYHNCVPSVGVIERWDGVFNCPGCAVNRKTTNCNYYACPTKKGYAHCAECGEYYSCDAYSDSHYPGQCNLGLTAGEVTSLVIPYAARERLNLLRDQIGTHSID